MHLAKLAAVRCAWPAGFTTPDHTYELGKDAVRQTRAVFIGSAYHRCAFERSRYGVREQRILQPGQADSVCWGPVHKCADARTSGQLLEGKRPGQFDVEVNIGFLRCRQRASGGSASAKLQEGSHHYGV